MTRQVKHSILWAAVAALTLATSARAEDVTVKLEDGSDWTISITPGESAPAEGKASTYSTTYGSIPFSRAEYDANHSYRHEATMELLFDQLRPGTKVTVQGAVDVDANVRRSGYYSPYRFGYRSNPIFGWVPWSYRAGTIRQVP